MRRLRVAKIKPVVHYHSYKDHTRPEIGWITVLIPTDHPSPRVSNTGPVWTSKVIDFDIGTGRIETENTIYVPAE